LPADALDGFVRSPAQRIAGFPDAGHVAGLPHDNRRKSGRTWNREHDRPAKWLVESLHHYDFTALMTQKSPASEDSVR
jgi:hypothetical protein